MPVSTSLGVSITTTQHVILCFLDPNRREKELVLHHGNALHQVRPGTGDVLGMVEEVWPGSQAEDGVEVGGCRGSTLRMATALSCPQAGRHLARDGQ